MVAWVASVLAVGASTPALLRGGHGGGPATMSSTGAFLHSGHFNHSYSMAADMTGRWLGSHLRKDSAACGTQRPPRNAR